MSETRVFRKRPSSLGEWGRLPTRDETQERLDKLRDNIESQRAKVLDEFASAADFGAVMGLFGDKLVDLETARELYILTLSHEGSWSEAWGEALKVALRYATYAERTSGLHEGIRSARQQSAKSWIRDHLNIWIQLDGEGVFTWVLGDL